MGVTGRRRQFCPRCALFRAASRGRLWPWTRLHCGGCGVSWWHLSLDRGIFGDSLLTRARERVSDWWAGACPECRGRGGHKMRCSKIRV